MNKEEFNKFWNTNFPRVNTINFQLRDNLKDKWVRIHNLPKLKRYPENDLEKQIILNRQNTIITDLIGEDNKFLLLITGDLSSFENIESKNYFKNKYKDWLSKYPEGL
jgi:hypothetical protein